MIKLDTLLVSLDYPYISWLSTNLIGILLPSLVYSIEYEYQVSGIDPLRLYPCISVSWGLYSLDSLTRMVDIVLSYSGTAIV
jgi:hypothetical protein